MSAVTVKEFKTIAEKIADLLQMDLKLYPNTNPPVLRGTQEALVPVAGSGHVTLEFKAEIEASGLKNDEGFALLHVTGDLWMLVGYYLASEHAYCAVIDGGNGRLKKGDAADQFTGKRIDFVMGKLARGVKAIYKLSYHDAKKDRQWRRFDEQPAGVDAGPSEGPEKDSGADTPATPDAAQVPTS